MNPRNYALAMARKHNYLVDWYHGTASKYGDDLMTPHISNNPWTTLTTASTTDMQMMWVNATSAGNQLFNRHPVVSYNSTTLAPATGGTISTALHNHTVINKLLPPDEIDNVEYARKFIRRFMDANCMRLSDLMMHGAAIELETGSYNLPGGAVLHIDTDSYQIDDSNHRTIYKANTQRNFNEFLNVSDILEQFMQYVADLKLSRQQFLELPLRLFMLWLIIAAAKKDGEPPPQPEAEQLELALEPLRPLAIAAE